MRVAARFPSDTPRPWTPADPRQADAGSRAL